jgi:hypothetical protein
MTMRWLDVGTPRHEPRLATVGGDVAFWLIVATVMAGVAALMWGTATTAY